jgi:hypothetical protein
VRERLCSDYPQHDAFTYSGDPTTNYGASTLLEVAASQTSYIQFNLASIPAGAVISQATLKLYVNSVAAAGSFDVDYASGAWSESALDYSNAPALGSAIASNEAITASDANQFILINITPAVVSWLNGSQANDGIVLVANGAFHASFDSKENTATSDPAELDIVFAGGTSQSTSPATANSARSSPAAASKSRLPTWATPAASCSSCVRSPSTTNPSTTTDRT